MTNPFDTRILPISGPARDIQPVTPNDGADLPQVAVALYVETGGVIVAKTPTGDTRTVTVPDFTLLPVGICRVLATGTTATGLHALVI